MIRSMIAGGLLAGLAAVPGVRHGLPIRPGSYVLEGTPCRDAPLAAMFSFDGLDLSGPHATQCHDVVEARHGPRWRIRSTCSALGDGTPAAASTSTADYTVLSRTRVARRNPVGAPASIFRLCSADKP